jgi:protein-tyrosine-phosphatase
MAAGMAKKMYPHKVFVESAGIAPLGNHAAPEAIAVMLREYGIDISEHQPQSVTNLAPSNFDYVIALDSYVYEHLAIYGHIASDKLIKWDIADPYTQDIDVFKACAKKIESCLQDTLNRLT